LVTTERERMVAGELYDAGDSELIRERASARALITRYNATFQDDPDERRALLIELLGALGEDAWIEPPFFCDYGWNIELGERVFFNFNCVVLDVAPVRVGAGTMLGPAVQLCTATHPLDPAERAKGLEYAQPIELGRDVWVGAAAVVGAGVTVGDGSVIGAGSVVVRDIPAGVLAAGNPCSVIREVAES
jgi:maltose O-acetyltransferase